MHTAVLTGFYTHTSPLTHRTHKNKWLQRSGHGRGGRGRCRRHTAPQRPTDTTLRSSAAQRLLTLSTPHPSLSNAPKTGPVAAAWPQSPQRCTPVCWRRRERRPARCPRSPRRRFHRHSVRTALVQLCVQLRAQRRAGRVRPGRLSTRPPSQRQALPAGAHRGGRQSGPAAGRTPIFPVRRWRPVAHSSAHSLAQGQNAKTAHSGGMGAETAPALSAPLTNLSYINADLAVLHQAPLT